VRRRAARRGALVVPGRRSERDPAESRVEGYGSSRCSRTDGSSRPHCRRVSSRCRGARPICTTAMTAGSGARIRPPMPRPVLHVVIAGTQADRAPSSSSSVTCPEITRRSRCSPSCASRVVELHVAQPCRRFSSNSRAPHPCRGRRRGGTTVGRDREEGEPRTIDGREVAAAHPASRRCPEVRASSRTQRRWNCLGGAKRHREPARRRQHRLPWASCPVTTRLTS